MISKFGRKIFFIHPPESLKGPFLENIFRQEFEIYLLENKSKIEELLDMFKDAIVFINIDQDLSYIQWAEYINKLNKKYKNVAITVFSKKETPSLKRTFLMDIGIKGGYIHLEEDNWKTVELVNQVLELNEARGRRKSVRLDFDKNENITNLSVKIFTLKGYSMKGTIKSISSAGILAEPKKGKIDDDDNVERVSFLINERELQVVGYLLKRFDNGDYFISFEDMIEDDKDYVQSYMFDILQKSFEKLINKL
ncbi:MAG: hypothetical protein OCD02_02510 [Spirochaetaceae bacterium]